MLEAEPAFTIRIRPRDSDKAFVFEAANGPPIKVGNKATLEKALYEQASLRSRLEELKAIGNGNVGLTLAEAGEALEKLNEAGKHVLGNLLGEDVDYYASEVTRLVETALADAKRAGVTPWVHVTSVDNDPLAHAIPFEIVPFTARRLSENVGEDETCLGEALDRFLGFVAVIRRDKGDTGAVNALARPAGRIPVKLFQNLSLANAKEEMNYFLHRREFHVDGPWPVRDLTPAQFKKKLLSYAFEPRALFGGGLREEADQIHHFACHCETFGDPSEHQILLEGDDGQSLGMKLLWLQQEYLELAQAGELPRVSKPLVFLNGCGATAVDPRHVGSFAKFFLSNRNRGFIGAQIMIPTGFAAAFSEMFYESLVFNGLSVGESVLVARRKLAEQKKNMLGLLYTHYGPTELQIAA